MNDGSFASACHNQARVLYALFLLEGQNRFARRAWGLFEELAGILIHVIGFSALRLMTGAVNHRGMPVIPFLVSGVFLYWMFKTTMVPVSNFHASKSRYVAHPRVTQLDVLLARAAVNIGLYLCVSLGTFYFLILIGLSAPIYNLGLVIVILLLGGIWGLGIGLVLGGLFSLLPIFRTTSSGFLRLVMYTSGIFFVWPEVPYALRPFVIYNPFFHLAEKMHSAYFEVYDSAVASWDYIICWIVLTFTLGLVVERRCRSMNHRERRPDEDASYAMDML